MINPVHPILLVDDEQKILFSYSLMLKSAGIHNVKTLQDSREVIPFLEKQEVSIIILDLVMPHVSGYDLLSQIGNEFPHIPIIVMTALNEIDKAVQCMKAGASDYLVKPVEDSRFLSSIQKVLEVNNLKDEISSLKRHLLSGELEHREAFSGIITKSTKMLAIFRYIEAIAESHKPILITGETGVGKELLARAVHKVSGLKGNHVAVNVAGLDDTIFSDTLFGHRKGAYTGADKDRPGLITKASEGTLLLDEIGDLNKSSQVKILRLLEEKIYYPLGSDSPEKSDARIIACCNQEIPTLIEAEKFRKDLYYRLCAHHIHLPPLRERSEDIPLLLDHFLQDASRSLKKEKPVPTCEVMALLSSYDFPGNIRELQAMVHHAVAEHKAGKLSLKGFKKFIKQDVPLKAGALSPSPLGNGSSISDVLGHFPTLKEMEAYLISEALKSTDEKQGPAAALLGISRQALNQRLKKKERSP